MESVNRIIRGWLEEARVLEAALRARHVDKESGKVFSDRSREEAQYLAFQLAVRVGQIRDARVVLDALSGQDSSGVGVSASARIGERQITAEIANLARAEYLSQATSLRIQDFTGFDDFFLLACDLRRLGAVAGVVSNVSSDVLQSIGNQLRKAAASMSHGDTLDFRDSVRNLLSNYFLYPGIKGIAGGGGRSRYTDLFSLIATNQQGNDMQTIEGLERALDEMGLDAQLRDVVSKILGRIQEMTNQGGSSLLDSVSGDGSYITGGSPDVMAIPGTGSAKCRPILLALAGGRARGSRSPKRVIQRMQEVLVECSPQTQIAIFLSDAAGLGSVLEDNLSLVEAHIRRGNLRGFLPVLVVGKRITVVNWRG